MLRWIQVLTSADTFVLSMELSGILTSITKSLLKLGFVILRKFKKVDCSNVIQEN